MTVNFDDEADVAKLRALAGAQKRSLSNYAAMVLEAHVRQAEGMVTEQPQAPYGTSAGPLPLVIAVEEAGRAALATSKARRHSSRGSRK